MGAKKCLKYPIPLSRIPKQLNPKKTIVATAAPVAQFSVAGTKPGIKPIKLLKKIKKKIKKKKNQTEKKQKIGKTHTPNLATTANDTLRKMRYAQQMSTSMNAISDCLDMFSSLDLPRPVSRKKKENTSPAFFFFIKTFVFTKKTLG